MRLMVVLLCVAALVGCGSAVGSSPQELSAPTATGGAIVPGASIAPRSSVAPGASIAPGASTTPRSATTGTGVPAAPRGSAPPTTDSVATIGSRITIGEVAVTLHGVQDNAPAGVIPTPPGTRRFAVEITIENLTPQPAPYSAFFGQLVLADGAQDTAVVSDQPAPSLTGGLIDPGASLRGWLAFEIPTDGKPVRFIYDQLTSRGEFTLP